MIQIDGVAGQESSGRVDRQRLGRAIFAALAGAILDELAFADLFDARAAFTLDFAAASAGEFFARAALAADDFAAFGLVPFGAKEPIRFAAGDFGKTYTSANGTTFPSEAIRNV